MTRIRISEIFGPTIQGEGALIGQPTIFIRTGGCDYRCAWCDTLHAVDSEYRHQWLPMEIEDIWGKVQQLSGHVPLMVSLSGGNPAIHDLKPLIDLGKMQGYRFALETQGSIAQDWFSDLNVLTLSPKPPSSSMETDWAKFDACLKSAQNNPEIALKIVVFDEADYQYAKDAATRYPHLKLYLQPGNQVQSSNMAETDSFAMMKLMRWLVDKITQDRWFNVTLLPQLHVLMWGQKRGV